MLNSGIFSPKLFSTNVSNYIPKHVPCTTSPPFGLCNPSISCWISTSLHRNDLLSKEQLFIVTIISPTPKDASNRGRIAA